MITRRVIVLGAALLLWNCNLPLESWYEEMTAGEETAETAASLPVKNPSSDPPADPPAPVVADEIDVRKIRWKDYDIGAWPIEDSAFGVSVDKSYISWTFDQSGWPSRDDVNGNIFFIWKENGRYYGESFEHIRPHAKRISTKEVKGGGKLRSKPDSWRPVKGREYGLVLTSHVRGWREVKRRTNIEIIRWQR